MQEYLFRTPLGAAMDRLGGTVALMLGSVAGFMLLWGVRLSALTAGLALGVMLLTLRERRRKQRLRRREAALRRRIGGELKMEQWLLMQPRRAHLEAALLLSQEYDLSLEKADEDGAVCTMEKTGEKLVIFCAQMHVKEKLSVRDIAACQRICLREKAARGVLCGAGLVSAEGKAQAQILPPLVIMPLERMIALAGAVWPATDAQLVELGKRKQQHRLGKTFWQGIMAKERERKYLLYGLLLCGLYLLTGLWVYLFPGCVCLLLLSMCRTGLFAEKNSPTL